MINQKSCNNAIGIFDSGIGGLTVLKEINSLLQNEDILYLGDTARLPYGSKTVNAIKEFSLENSKFLISKNVKIIVIACNTASAVSLEYLKSMLDILIVGVVESGALAAARVTSNNKIGVIGTKTTIKSQAYSKAIKKDNPNINVYEVATPLLVHLVEENWINKAVTKEILLEYLNPLFDKNIDTLVLGCTHYPFLSKKILEINPQIKLVDSAFNTAINVKNILKKKCLLTEDKKKGNSEIFLTDIAIDSQTYVNNFLGKKVQLKKKKNY